jgi:hypothetical protein
MYCPKCSQPQVSDEIRFCSRCGFLLTGISEVIKNEGIIPNSSKQKNVSTPRKKGFKQGLFALLLLILTAPIILITGKEFEIHPAPLFLTLFIVFISSIIRMIYALMFESNERAVSEYSDSGDAPNIFQDKTSMGSLPSPQTNPLADFVPPIKGNWRDSNELVFSGASDVTTRQLKSEE